MPVLVGGPLTDEYIFDSGHFHWAQNPDDVGAMHRINGKRSVLLSEQTRKEQTEGNLVAGKRLITRAASDCNRCDLEFHLVHYKKSFKTRQDAMFQPDGLAVTSFLIQARLRFLTF